MNREVGLQNAVKNLLFCGDASHDFIHLGNNGAEEGGRTEEQKDTEDLHADK